MNKAVSKHMAALGSKGGKTKGASKARTREQATKAVRTRWEKRARELQELVGVKAIVHLQGMAGIRETASQARDTWRKMNDLDKAQTLLAWERFKPKPGN